MDLTYTDVNRIEQGALHNFYVDFDATNTKDFQISVGIKNNVLQGGSWWYIEGTEYGGRVDAYSVITESNEIQYTGRNFRGILASKIIEPPAGQDYKIVSGNMKDVVNGLIEDVDLQDIFVADDCSVEISSYKVNRYVTLYDGLVALGIRNGLIPSFTVKDGIVHIAFYPPTDYSDENEYSETDTNFTIKKTYGNVNHLICLGSGELKNRIVVHLYADAEGNISTTQSLFGLDEVVSVYENTNAEDAIELKAEGMEKLAELKNTDSFEVTTPNIELKVGDIIGGIESVTNTYVAREIVNVIAKISDTKIDLEYKVGEDDATPSRTSGGESSGTSSGGGVYNLPPATKEAIGGVIVGDNIDVDADGRISVTIPKVTVDSAFSTTSTNPVQNKVVTNWLNANAPTYQLKKWAVGIQAFNTNTWVTRATELANTVNELLILVRVGATNFFYEFKLIPSLMTGTHQYVQGYSTGAATSGTYHGTCELDIDWTNKKLLVKSLILGNTTYTNGTFYLYYR